MPDRKSHQPAYRHYKPKNLAVVRIDGRDHYLGRYDSPESRQRYYELLAKREREPAVTKIATLPPVEPSTESEDPGEVTVTMLVVAFWKWAQKRYRKSDGTPTREAGNYKPVIKRLRRKYGKLPVAKFGSRRLLAFRDGLISATSAKTKTKLTRSTINAMIRKVQVIFRWGVSRELVPIKVLQRLETLVPLQENEGGRETSGSRGAVEWALVEKTIP